MHALHYHCTRYYNTLSPRAWTPSQELAKGELAPIAMRQGFGFRVNISKRTCQVIKYLQPYRRVYTYAGAIMHGCRLLTSVSIA